MHKNRAIDGFANVRDALQELCKEMENDGTDSTHTDRLDWITHCLTENIIDTTRERNF